MLLILNYEFDLFGDLEILKTTHLNSCRSVTVVLQNVSTMHTTLMFFSRYDSFYFKS